MSEFVEVTSVDKIGGKGLVVTIDGNDIALFRSGTRVVAICDTCIRCGSSIAAGVFDSTYVTCSGCDWKYDVATGCVLGLPELWIDTFEVKVDGSTVSVATICRTALPR
jgi:nitrite reductase/ring-hydroxylating ferredoxin subunit